MKKIKIVLIILFTFLSYPAYSMENASDAIDDTRTVPIIVEHALGDQIWKSCTGFLYSERIVLTAGHCLFNRSTGRPYPKQYVGLPGVAYSTNTAKLFEVETIIYPNGWSYRGTNDLTDIEDFGILILKNPIGITGKTIIANEEQINFYINNKTLVSTVGYGKQSSIHGHNSLTVPKYGEFPLESFSIVQQFLPSNKYYGMKIHITQVPGGPSSCDGDSGSPLYVKEYNNFIYLGAIAWGIGGMPNCSGKPWETDRAYLGSVAAYDYLYLIKQAEEYVGIQSIIDTSAPVKKITIKCYKGKSIKKILSVKPKCPKGYKAKV